MKSVYTCDEFDRARLDKLWQQTDDIRLNMDKYARSLDGKIVSTLFYEPSTRTRLSFESAVCRLGGKVISTENAKTSSSVFKGETLEDTIRVIEGYSDAMVIRHPDDHWTDIAKKYSKKPIINGGSGKNEHPTQALLDVYTLYREKPSLDGLKVCVLGDLLYGRTVHSLLNLLSNYDNITVYGLSNEELTLPDEWVEKITKKGIEYHKCDSFDDVPNNIDALYQTRIQWERMEQKYATKYYLTKEVMKKFSDKSLILHPLPRLDEIYPELDSDPRSMFFEQAHNGVFVRMTLLYNALA